MHCEVFRVLQAAEVDHVASELAKQSFTDGKLTAGGHAREVKYNLQADRAEPGRADLDRIVIAALERHPEFQVFAMPRRIVAPIFSRYEPGMEYGDHIDSSVMGNVRTDLAMTLFLSPPASYQGGELTVHSSLGEQEIKLDSGEAIVYPANAVHHVNPVTSGIRLAAVTWVQSRVKEEELRAILYDLSRAMKKAEKEPDHGQALLLSKSYHNLVRYAAEP
jgi:PKHD-type hydroxylase